MYKWNKISWNNWLKFFGLLKWESVSKMGKYWDGTHYKYSRILSEREISSHSLYKNDHNLIVPNEAIS